jgi:hypothetical protein
LAPKVYPQLEHFHWAMTHLLVSRPPPIVCGIRARDKPFSATVKPETGKIQ